MIDGGEIAVRSEYANGSGLITIPPDKMYNGTNNYRLLKTERMYVYGSNAKRRSNLEKDLASVIGKLNLPGHVISRAYELLDIANKRKLWNGRKREGMLGAIVFAACREAGTPYSIADISNIVDVKKKYIYYYYTLIHPELNKTVSVSALIPALISKFAAKFGLSQKTAQKAYDVHEYIQSRAGPAPEPKHTQAYVVSLVAITAAHTEPGFFRTQIQLGLAASTNSITIKNRIRDIKQATVNFKWDCPTLDTPTIESCPMAIPQMNPGVV